MDENREFLNALRFMTIVPVPSSDAAIAPDWLSRCARYFPVVGIGIGLASAVVLLLADRIWSPVVASLLAVATSIAVTGAPSWHLVTSGPARGAAKVHAIRLAWETAAP